MQQNPQTLQQPKRRRCAEVCMELLSIEAVQLFTTRLNGPAAPETLEAIGFRVGRQLAEKYSKDKPRMGEPLEIIKFVCKDFWQAVFKKQVDNLRTNHRGVYVLLDSNFRWLSRLAPPPSAAPALTPQDPSREAAIRAAAQAHLLLPCGIIRGALTHLGLACTVEADSKALPACAFTIKITV
ncbi:MAG: hypothetical protein WDW38_002827 [Sanguina aurantia]